MADSRTRRMRSYWDEAARRNAAWYVDTSLRFDEPDMDRFFATGRQVVAEALDSAPVAPPGRGLAVEIGAGLGRVCAALAERFDEVVGVDISPEMLRRARDLVDQPRVRFLEGDGGGLGGVPDGTADLVLSFTVFQHIPDPAVVEAYIVDAGRVLRPGGVLVFQWNNEPGPLRWRARRGVLALLQRTRLRPERHRRHAAEFLGSRIPLRRVEAALTRGGFDLVGTRGTGTLYAWAWARRRA